MAAFPPMQKIHSILSSGAYLLMRDKNLVFTRIRKIALPYLSARFSNYHIILYIMQVSVKEGEDRKIKGTQTTNILGTEKRGV